MRHPPFDPKAPKRTVSLTLNSDLYAKAKSAGINASRVAEEALAYEVQKLEREKLAAEIRQDIEWLAAYEAEHGSFADALRKYHDSMSDEPGDAPV